MAASLRSSEAWRRVLSRRSGRLSRTLCARCESSEAAADLSLEHEVDEEAKIPLVSKKKDPHAVLRALASTVTPLPRPLIGGRSIADPMTPRTRNVQLDYERAKEAGRKSAQYVINRWPAMFPDFVPEPDLRPSTDVTHEEMSGEEKLKNLIERRQTGWALKLYRKLQENGDPVSLETQNGLLELLAYYGLGNWGRGGVKVKEQEEEEVEKEDGGNLDQLAEELGRSGSDEAAAFLAGKEKEEVVVVAELEAGRSLRDKTHLMQFQKPPTSRWSAENYAEKFFAEMPEKNGATYDALILGLVKYREYDRVWVMFDAMRKDGGHQASLATYNSLLFVTGTIDIADPWSKAMNLMKQMKQEPVVQPDITTMNLLLEISSQTGRTELSLQTIRETLHLGLEPNLTSFLALMRAYMNSGDGSVLYDVTEYLETHQHLIEITGTQDIYFFNVAMTAARNMLDQELAMKLAKLCDRDNWMFCQNITLFVSYYLGTITGRIPIDQLKKEYDRFVPDLALPMEWVYGIMFRACEEQDSVTFALQLWNHIKRYHVDINNIETLSRFCGAMAKTVFPSEMDAVLTALMQAWDKALEIETQPPSVMIAQIIRLYCLKQNFPRAWEFYLLYEKYDRRPTFQAMLSLLKAYSGAHNAKKTEVMLRHILKHKMILPTTFVRDVSWKAGVNETARNELLSEFSRNEEERNRTKRLKEEVKNDDNLD